LLYRKAARLWTANLGAGKPYDEDIDARLEDWLAYRNYVHLKKNTAAKRMLDNIISFSENENGGKHLKPSANSLVTALTLKEAGKEDEAKNYLQQLSTENPANVWAQWAAHRYDRETYELPQGNTLNDNYTMLKRWMEFDEVK
jgi:predicted Zn-dependent protease